MIALGPARAFETNGAPGDGDGRKQQRQKSNSEKTWDGDVSFYFHRIRDGRVLGIDFRLDAQIIMTCGNAGDDDGIFRAAFGPGAVAVRAVVITDFAAEIPGLPGVLIDQRVIEI